MGSAAVAATSTVVQRGFEELDRQRELITSCTQLWKELSDHFTTLERGLQDRSDSLRRRRQNLDLSVRRTLDSLHHREQSIDGAVDHALARVDELRDAALLAASDPPSEDGLADRLRSLCSKMDVDGFWDLVVSKRKEMETLRSELPLLLTDCIDPPKFAMDAISKVFPVDRRAGKSPSDLGWACVLILESLIPALADPELGAARPLVTHVVKERAKEMADGWKEGLQQRGGVEGARPADMHAFLQLVGTFGVATKEDKELYRKLVLSVAWRKQMPKLALLLGLEDRMTDMVEELISKGQQLDAINFAYEASLEDKFPPVPLLKSFLKDSKKVTTSNLEDQKNSGQAMFNASRKEQSAIRAVMKCIEDRKLEAEFPLEGLHKRLEHLEKAKTEKKKTPGAGGPANKRTRANNGSPMPPAKAGRMTNNAYVSSFPATAAATFVRSPSVHTTYPAMSSPYPYDRTAGHGVYSSRSPVAIRDPYAYPTEQMPPATLGAAYPLGSMNYPPYGGYSNGMGGYSNSLIPGYQQAYYRYDQ